MDQNELTQLITDSVGKAKIVKLAKVLRNQFRLRDLIAITFHNDGDIAFRAAWLLENVVLDTPETFENDITYLISMVSEKITHHGPQRHYAKIVMHLTKPSAPQVIQDIINGIDLQPVVEQLFDWMINPKVKIAVKALAAEALFNLRGRYPWISDELAAQLQFLMRDGTAAIQTKGKKLLKALK